MAHFWKTPKYIKRYDDITQLIKGYSSEMEAKRDQLRHDFQEIDMSQQDDRH